MPERNEKDMLTIVKADSGEQSRFIHALKKRAQQTDKDVSAVVAQIIENVRAHGDQAVREYTEKFDGVAPEKQRSPHRRLQRFQKAARRHFYRRWKKRQEISGVSINGKYSKAGLPPKTTGF